MDMDMDTDTDMDLDTDMDMNMKIDMDGWIDMDGYGWIWMDMDGYGWICMKRENRPSRHGRAVASLQNHHLKGFYVGCVLCRTRAERDKPPVSRLPGDVGLGILQHQALRLLHVTPHRRKRHPRCLLWR